jgi:SAM-dependent methyltransferase
MLTAYRGIVHQPLLRGRMEGITPGECRAMLSFRDRFRRGTASHVFLHARLDRRQADVSRDVRTEIRRAGFKTELIKANVRKLERIVAGLEWRVRGSTWSDYGATTSYTEEGAEEKLSFVRGVVETRSWGQVWDLGCNDGRFSRIAAESADHVVAVDLDEVVVEGLYRALRAEGVRNVLPLTMSLSDPSPALGWRGAERPRFEDRGSPDLTLALALVHHVCITDNVPVVDFVGWLAERGGAVVVEFVDRDDPMAAALLARKVEGSNPDYTPEHFARRLGERFTIEREERVSPGTRTLYYATPRR